MVPTTTSFPAPEMMVLGRRFGPDDLNVFDDGSIPGQRGTTLYDDEGVSARRNYLIKNGILVGRLHSRETAAKMGETPSGNARAINYRFPPIVRMTNTAIENSTTSFEDMIKDIELGIYACNAYGGQTMLESSSSRSIQPIIPHRHARRDALCVGNRDLRRRQPCGEHRARVRRASGIGYGLQAVQEPEPRSHRPTRAQHRRVRLRVHNQAHHAPSAVEVIHE
jgi:hypothetical protein